jgi:hypothetical protein
MNPAQVVIDAFGGIRATARAINAAPSVVHYWTVTGVIPVRRIRPIIRAAALQGVIIDPLDLVCQITTPRP